ncbi:MAG: hypothetical protein FD167_4446 [bacterium]|nr:MAG: hypothetical protein FD167_4446 [bacterium]
MSWKQFFLASILVLIFNIVTFAQINDIPPPSLPDPALLADIFQATDNLQKQGKVIEFKEQLGFRLACILPEGRRTRGVQNRNVDFRQSADYAIRADSGQILEKKLLEVHQPPRFDLNNLFRIIDIPTIQETFPAVASIKTAFLTFVSKEFVNGYKEVEREKINKQPAIKLALKFRPGRIPIENCFLWIDEKTHVPLQAELKIGDIGRYSDVVLKIFFDKADLNQLPNTITQEVSCSTYEDGIPLRLEQTSIYSELKAVPKEE